jgi:hypothetical protein
MISPPLNPLFRFDADLQTGQVSECGVAAPTQTAAMDRSMLDCV